VWINSFHHLGYLLQLIEEKIEAHRRLREQLNTERKKSVHEKEENLLIEYSNQNPLNLVNTIETLYPSIIHTTKFDSLNTLSSYKASQLPKIHINVSGILWNNVNAIILIILLVISTSFNASLTLLYAFAQ